MTTYAAVLKLGLLLPGAEESTSYGTPALKVHGQLFARWKEDRESLVLRCEFGAREELMAADPETYYITDHYLKYPYVLVRLSRVGTGALRELLATSHRLAAKGSKRKRR